MYTLELSHEELDCLCQALNSAASQESNEDITGVYEKLRQDIRTKHPLNSSMAKMVAAMKDGEAALKGQDEGLENGI